MRQVLFLQGGGPGVHDEWDGALVADLRQVLGAGWEVRYPRMPDEDDPSWETWGPAIRRAVAALGPGSVVVGHSVGGTLLLRALADTTPPPRLAGIVLVAAPFVGPGGWPGDALPPDLGARLPQGVPVHVFHGLDDDTVRPSHAALCAGVVGQARVHLLPGRDHQLGDDLSGVAAVVGALGTAAGGP